MNQILLRGCWQTPVSVRSPGFFEAKDKWVFIHYPLRERNRATFPISTQLLRSQAPSLVELQKGLGRVALEERDRLLGGCGFYGGWRFGRNHEAQAIDEGYGSTGLISFLNGPDGKVKRSPIGEKWLYGLKRVARVLFWGSLADSGNRAVDASKDNLKPCFWSSNHDVMMSLAYSSMTSCCGKHL